MIASAPAWAVWLALGLWGVAICTFVVLFLYARSVWRRLAPSIVPLLTAFGFGGATQAEAAAGTGNSVAESGASPAVAPSHVDGHGDAF